MVAGRFAEHDDAPSGDGMVLLRNTTWADYLRMQEVRGDSAVPRLSFLEGVLEIRSPSRDHQRLKSDIGRLVEVWCLERGIDFNTHGSWTLQNKDLERGAEPDECYVFGNVRDPQVPDLAIEVIWTSGGLDKREIYRQLDVRELWLWRRGVISVFGLRGADYVELAASEVLPGIDLIELASFLDREPTSQAMRDYRAALTTKR